MNKEKNKYIKIAMTIMTSGLAFTINYFISFFLAPYITKRVGTDAYGFVTLAKDFAVYATFITLALNAYSARFISLEYYKPDIKKANVYFSSVFWGNTILGVIIFSIACITIYNLEHLLQIPKNIITDVKLLFFFVFLKFLLITIFSVFESSAYITNHLDITGVFKGLSYCVEAALLLTLFMMFRAKVYFVGIGILVAALVVVISNIWITKKYASELRVRRKDFRFSAVKTLVFNGVWSSISQFGNLLNSGLDLTVTNLLISPLAMGQLAIAESIQTIYTSIYGLVSESFKPLLLKIYSKQEKERLIKEFNIAVKTSGFFAAAVFAGFFALGSVYYRLWLPHEDIHLLYQLTMLVLASSLIVGIESPLFYIYTLTLTRHISCMFTLITGFLNVISMYVLITYFHMGLFVVVGTTLVLQFIIHAIPHPLYMSHVLHIKWYSFYPAILRCFLSCSVMCIAFYGLSKLYMPGTWISLILCAFVYSAAGIMIHMIFALSSEERKLLIAKIKRSI